MPAQMKKELASCAITDGSFYYSFFYWRAFFFTRGYWMPLIFPSAATPIAITPQVTSPVIPTAATIQPTQILGTGDVQITLRWAGYNDLDLHVYDPEGNEIWYGSPNSSTGGLLDVDSNAGCGGEKRERPVENIYWPVGSAPRGEYTVAVVYYAVCTDTPATPFIVTVLVDGVSKEFTGSVSRSQQKEVVYTFTR
jgi:hypothetical protein